MSSSSSSPKTTTTTTDLRTTNTLNAGLSGDISDALVAAGNYGDTNLAQISNSFADNSDNSLKVDLADYSNRSVNDYSDNSSSYSSNYSSNYSSSFADNSDNSLKVNLSDASNRSVNDYSDHSVTNITDGGAFGLVTASQKETYGTVNNIIASSYNAINQTNESAYEKIDKANSSAIDFVKESGAAMMDFVKRIVTTNMENSNALAAQSLAGAMNIKAGEVISDPANQNLKTIVKAGVAIAGIGGLLYVMRSKK